MRPLQGSALHLGILCGGLSLRMGKDKAHLEYHQGLSQRDFCRSLGQKLKLPTVFSINPQQQADPYYHAFAHVVDSWADCGPMGGIASLLASQTESAWLMIACDMPSLCPELLQTLLSAHAQKKPAQLASVFETNAPPHSMPNSQTPDAHSSSHLEPLCAVYEPATLKYLQEALNTGRYGLQRLLQKIPIQRIPCNTNSMRNINTPQDLERFHAADGLSHDDRRN